MEDKKSVFLRALMVMIGGIVGVGIFGLPYVFARAGVVLGLVHLVLLGATMLIMMLAYSDLVLQTNGRARLKTVVERYIGSLWARVASLAFLFGAWGALLSYIIVGGTFLHALLSPWLGGAAFWYQLVFFTVCSVLLLGGLGLISRLETAFVGLMFLLLAIVLTGSLPFINPENLSTLNWDYSLLPFGAILFATAGLGVIPEVADVLGAQKKSLLKRVIAIGAFLIIVLYAIFVLTVVGVSGTHTSPEAIVGLGAYLGDWLVYLGVIIGTVTLFSSFMIIGTEIISMLTFDFKRRYLQSWLWAIGVPLIAFSLGARNFIKVIGFTGGLLVSLIGLIVIVSYLQAKKHPGVAKRAFLMPNFALYFCGVIYLIAAFSTLLSR